MLPLLAALWVACGGTVGPGGEATDRPQGEEADPNAPWVHQDPNATGTSVECLGDPNCDDGIFCNGLERCIGGLCRPGEPASCDDGIDCTTDRCDLAADACVADPVDRACDDGLACTGAERCDATAGCAPAEDAGCDDAIACTRDECQEPDGACASVPDHRLCAAGERCDPVLGCLPGAPCALDADCDDGFHCNGVETCVDGGCTAGVEPTCDDELGCTSDRCDEGTDRCEHVAVDASCDDGAWCNGAERCDAARGCLPGTPPACGDGIECTADACDEGRNACTHDADDAVCAADEACDAIDDCVCDGDAGTCGACGDVNRDGRLDIADGVRCRDLVLAGGYPATCCDTFRADFQRDGDVDMEDCRAIERWQLEGGPGCGAS